MVGVHDFAGVGEAVNRRDWGSQFGVGMLVPIGRNWAALADMNWSNTETEASARVLGVLSVPRSSIVRTRRVAVLPAFVRTVRTKEGAFYIGGGYGYVRGRVWTLRRPVLYELADLFGNPLNVNYRETFMPVVVRAGVVVDVSPKVVCRMGYTALFRHIDAAIPHSLEIGLGVRF